MVSNASHVERGYIGADNGRNLILKAANSSYPNLVLDEKSGVSIPKGDLKLGEGRFFAPQQTRFFAYLTKNQPVKSSSEKVALFVGDEAFYNVGNGYSFETGLFKAPTEGMYQFDCSMTANPPSNVISNNIVLTIGDLVFRKFYSKTTQANKGAVFTYKVSQSFWMKAGEVASCWLRLIGENGSEISFTVRGDPRPLISTFFSGFQLH